MAKDSTDIQFYMQKAIRKGNEVVAFKTDESPNESPFFCVSILAGKLPKSMAFVQ